jgi:hypothetical protein
MAEKRRKAARRTKRGEPRERIERTKTISAPDRSAISRARRFGLGSRYVAFLLRAIRDGLVHDWTSLLAFRAEHNLRLVKWGSSVVGEAPAVENMLEQLQESGLITVEGVDFRRYLGAHGQRHQGPARQNCL